MTDAMLKDWLEYYNPDLGRVDLLKAYSGIKDGYYNQVRTIADNFMEIIEKRKSAGRFLNVRNKDERHSFLG